MPGSIPIGISRNNSILINPSENEIFQKTDKIIVITEDDDTCKPSSKAFPIQSELIDIKPFPKVNPEKTLILGWSPTLPLIISASDEFAPMGSVIVVANPLPEETAVTKSETDNFTLENISVQYIEAYYSNLKDLGIIKPEIYDNIILLNNHSRNLNSEDKDAQTLMNLLLLRKYLDDIDIQVNITTEMECVQNQQLAQAAKINDFIMSSQIISMILAQISEEPQLYDIYQDLFHPSGSEIYLKQADSYVKVDEEMNFATVIAAAYEKHHIAIGYRIMTDEMNSNNNFGITLNPDKESTCQFKPGDMFIVIAED